MKINFHWDSGTKKHMLMGMDAGKQVLDPRARMDRNPGETTVSAF